VLSTNETTDVLRPFSKRPADIFWQSKSYKFSFFLIKFFTIKVRIITYTLIVKLREYLLIFGEGGRQALLKTVVNLSLIVVYFLRDLISDMYVFVVQLLPSNNLFQCEKNIIFQQRRSRQDIFVVIKA